jgi:hypothetical protein
LKGGIMMGRPRKSLSQKRVSMSISIPRTLMLEMDKQLTEKQTRSRWIESLIKRAITPVHGSIDPNIRHEWECLACGAAWSTNRPKEQTFACMKRHCRSDQIEYVGIINEGGKQ